MTNLEETTLKGRYRIEELIGRGGMAEVYQAWDTSRSYYVAVKVMREDLAEDLDFVRRFQREARALAALSHANIVRFYSFERDGPLAFIVMDYVAGSTLRRRILEAGGHPLPLDEVAAITQQICAALHYAHSENVLHRDIKPGNIMIQPDPLAGPAGRVLVADFGIAKAADASTVTTVMPGTPAYMSPEQCRSELLDVRADVYSLGVMVYEILAGRRPFVGEHAPADTGGTREKIRWEQLHAAPPPLGAYNPAVPPEVEAVVLRALAKEPPERWATALEFGLAFGEAWQPGGAISVVARGITEVDREPAQAGVPDSSSDLASARQGLWFRSLPVWAWAAGGFVVAAFVLGIVLGAGGDGPSPAISTAQPVAQGTATPMPTDTPVPAPTSTPELLSTDTPVPLPTDTPSPPPTDTPIPPPTDTPAPALGDTWQRPADGMVMVYVPGGSFEMGSPDGDSDELPVHTVDLYPFWIDQTEVTADQYRECVAAGICQAPTLCDWGEPTYGDPTKGNHPVICADWTGANAYCQWAGGRLPTEAEWEYAARGPDSFIYPWGNTFYGGRANSCDASCDSDWRDQTYDDGYRHTAPVASFPAGASWCGALDMAGNVWEWVADWYGEDYYSRSPVENPTGPLTGVHRVLRGGSWHSHQSYLRAAYRNNDLPNSRNIFGFRCVSEGPVW